MSNITRNFLAIAALTAASFAATAQAATPVGEVPFSEDAPATAQADRSSVRAEARALRAEAARSTFSAEAGETVLAPPKASVNVDRAAIKAQAKGAGAEKLRTHFVDEAGTTIG